MADSGYRNWDKINILFASSCGGIIILHSRVEEGGVWLLVVIYSIRVVLIDVHRLEFCALTTLMGLEILWVSIIRQIYWYQGGNNTVPWDSMRFYIHKRWGEGSHNMRRRGGIPVHITVTYYLDFMISHFEFVVSYNVGCTALHCLDYNVYPTLQVYLL